MQQQLAQPLSNQKKEPLASIATQPTIKTSQWHMHCATVTALRFDTDQCSQRRLPLLKLLLAVVPPRMG